MKSQLVEYILFIRIKHLYSSLEETYSECAVVSRLVRQGRCICTHLVDPSLTHFLGEFPGLGLALEPDVVVPEAEQGCAWSRNLDPNFCPGRGRTSDLRIQRPRTLPLDYRTPPPFSRLLRHAGGYSETILTPNPIITWFNVAE